MSEKQSRKNFTEELIAQDRELNAYSSGDLQKDLEKILESRERHARNLRRASNIVGGVFILMVIATLLLLNNIPGWAREIWGGFSITVLLTAGILSYLYQYKCLPAIENTKASLQIAMIKELQQQVAALMKKSEENKEK